MRRKFLVITVKKLLKSVYICRSYRKIKTGIIFLEQPVVPNTTRGGGLPYSKKVEIPFAGIGSLIELESLPD